MPADPRTPELAPQGSAAPDGPPPLPVGLAQALASFRRQVRVRKWTEGLAAVFVACALSFGFVALIDRFVDTAPAVRAGAFGLALLCALVVVPRLVRRWLVGLRTPDAVANVVAARDAGTGDRLLGVLELTRDADEYRRSPALVRAAVAQADRDFAGRDLSPALPPSRHRTFATGAGGAAAVLGVFAALEPAWFGNALARWGLPFGGTARYTFARLADHGGEWVVPHQEERAITLSLAADSRRTPDHAELRLDSGTVRATLEASTDAPGEYTLNLPPLGADEEALLVVGDVRQTVRVLPRVRPEITAAEGTVQLPAYLEQPGIERVDVRGGAFEVVAGASVGLVLDVARELRSVEFTAVTDGEAAEALPQYRALVQGTEIRVPAEGLEDERTGEAAPTGARFEMSWTDTLGLAGPRPFVLDVRTRPDAAPTCALSGLEREAVLLETRAETFDVLSNDDFGVRRVGLEWRRFDARGKLPVDATGEKVLGSFAPGTGSLTSIATLHAEADGLVAGHYQLRAWALDALPGRERAYSAPVELLVLTEGEHMEWVTANLERWMQRVREVRDRELELLARNKELAALNGAELATPAGRRKIEDQARAERANRARLLAIAGQGDDLLAEAARNDGFGSNALDDWAEASRALRSIAEQRMDDVAQKLESAARQSGGDGDVQGGEGQSGPPAGAEIPGTGDRSGGGEQGDDVASADPSSTGSQSNSPQGEAPKTVGEDRSAGAGDGPKPSERPKDEVPPLPIIQDGESRIADPLAGGETPGAADEEANEDGGTGAAPSLTLAETTLGPAGEKAAPSESTELQGPQPPAPEPKTRTQEEIEAAIAAQEALLAEFEEVAGELETVLASLENSTFVKRLKAASRAQIESARALDSSVVVGFGSVVATARDDVAAATADVAERRSAELPKLEHLHDDMDAYLARLRSRSSEDVERFQRVLDEWDDVRPAVLADQLVRAAEKGRPGEARADADFLGDTLDRWGEELVGPG